MRTITLFAAILLALPAWAGADEATVYKTPWCGCCTGYVDFLRDNGFDVTVKELEDLTAVKRMAGVGETMESCHTTMVGGYVVEGHVPLKYLRKLLDEKPEIRGISLPGMPTGVPGMPGPRPEGMTIYTLEKNPKVFARE